MKKTFFIYSILNILLILPLVAQNDTSLYFDGIDDYIEIQNMAMNSIGTNDFTYEAYVNGDESLQKNSHPIILSNRSLDVIGCQLFFHDLWGNSQHKMLSLQLDGSNYFLINNGTYNGSILDGTCHHIAVSRENDSLFFYVDGALIGNKIIRGSPTIYSTAPIWIGQDLPTNNAFKGTISQVRIWGMARTETEIYHNINLNIAGNTPGLLGYWKLNEKSGQVAIDKTANNDGQLGSSATIDIHDPQRSSNYCFRTIDVHNNSLDNSLLISPNPNNGKFRIELTNPINTTSVEVYDIVGTKVFGETIRSNDLFIDISSEPEGIYFIRLNINGKSIIKETVKQ